MQLWASKGTNENQEDVYSKHITRSATFQLGAGNDVDSDEEERDLRSMEAKETSSRSPQTGGGHSRKTETRCQLANFLKSCLDASDCYELVWETRTAIPVRLMCFSPDGTLFATAGMNDPLVKVWYQDKPCKCKI